MSGYYRPIVIATGRHPFEVCVLAASVLVGIALALSGVSPKSVAASMPGVVQTLWHGLLITGGMIGLCGVFAPVKLVARLGVEAAGVVILGSATTMYSIALFAISGMQALAAGSFVVAIASACWGRAYQILRDIRRAGNAAERGRTAQVPLLVEERR